MTYLAKVVALALAAIALAAPAASAICVEKQTIWINGNPYTVERRCIPPE